MHIQKLEIQILFNLKLKDKISPKTSTAKVNQIK